MEVLGFIVKFVAMTSLLLVFKLVSAIFVLILMLSRFHYSVWGPVLIFYLNALFMWDATEK